MRRRLTPLLAATLMLTACGPRVAALPRYGDPPAEAQLVQSEYDVLLGDYILPLQPAVLGLAASTGMHDAVAAEAGATAAQAFPYLAFMGNSADVRREIGQEYVAATQRYPQVSTTTIAHDAMASMAQSVDDCHTNFFTPSQYREQQAELQGNVQFGGIGASLKDRPGSTPLIGEVFSGLPAAKAGLKPGDAILRVNGQSVQGLSATTVVSLIRGKVGTVVQLDVQRSGQGIVHFSITRQDVTPPSLSAGTLTTTGGATIGYVHVYGFTPDMPPQLQQALQQFSQRGANQWIVDLRDNSGGTLQALVDTASLFLPQGPIARFQDRSGKTSEIDTTGQTVPPPQKLVLLVNHDSASAAEIFASALQERASVTVVGASTAGCVAVGEMHPLADGSAIEYAAEKVYSPVQNRLLNGSGVTPTIQTPMTLDDLAAGKDPQLSAAVGVLDGQVTPTVSPKAPNTTPPAGTSRRFVPAAQSAF